MWRRASIWFLLVTLIGVCPAWADDDTKHGKAHERGESHERGDDGRGRGEARDIPASMRFADRDRVILRDYYVGEFREGRCPPGLAKKHNGCLPPGQAKKWAVGRPLPRGVIFHELPPQIVVQLTVPPPGYRYVRIADDILMIAAGTGLVIDAVQDLSRP